MRKKVAGVEDEMDIYTPKIISRDCGSTDQTVF